MKKLKLSMDNITLIELVLVCVIIMLQTRFGLKTLSKINFLRRIVPTSDFFKITKHKIPSKDLRDVHPKHILSQLSSYDDNEEDEEDDYLDVLEVDKGGNIYTPDDEEHIDTNLTEVSLINPNEKTNPVFDELLYSINVYLLRNKGATTDFKLIEDIVERKINSHDDSITQTVTIPLYMGLMGTMLGIVFGLANLYLASSTSTNFEVQGFLLGVSIAMIASFYGLGWTVYNSSFNHKSARIEVEDAKNDFYTFMQIELLPIINKSISSSVHHLHTNLVKFNEDFGINVNELSGLLNQNYDAIKAQDRILQKLDTIDIAKFVKANLDIMVELRTGSEQFAKFNQYLGLLDDVNTKGLKLSNSFNAILSETNNFKHLAEKLDQRIEEVNKLVTFLDDHYTAIDNSREYVLGAVKNTDDILVKSLNELRNHASKQVDAIKEIVIKEEDLMTKELANNRSHFSKLSLLEELNQNSIDLKNTFSSQLEGNNKILEAINEKLELLESRGAKNKKSFFTKFKNWFKLK